MRRGARSGFEFEQWKFQVSHLLSEEFSDLFKKKTMQSNGIFSVKKLNLTFRIILIF